MCMHKYGFIFVVSKLYFRLYESVKLQCVFVYVTLKLEALTGDIYESNFVSGNVLCYLAVQC